MVIYYRESSLHILHSNIYDSYLLTLCYSLTYRGQTALHKAALYKLRNICCMLVAGGATVNVADNKGMTPRLLALQAEDMELAAYLESESNISCNRQ